RCFLPLTSHLSPLTSPRYFNRPEHKRIIANPQRLSAGSGYIPENNLFCPDVRKLLRIRAVPHFRIKIGENGGAVIGCRMSGVVDSKMFNRDAFGHITGVPEIMLTRIRAVDQGSTYRLAGLWHENAVAYNKCALPGTAIVGAQVDKAPSIDGGVFNG